MNLESQVIVVAVCSMRGRGTGQFVISLKWMQQFGSDGYSSVQLEIVWVQNETRWNDCEKRRSREYKSICRLWVKSAVLFNKIFNGLWLRIVRINLYQNVFVVATKFDTHRNKAWASKECCRNNMWVVHSVKGVATVTVGLGLRTLQLKRRLLRVLKQILTQSHKEF